MSVLLTYTETDRHVFMGLSAFFLISASVMQLSISSQFSKLIDIANLGLVVVRLMFAVDCRVHFGMY